ncbi:MAG: 6-phosphogluconolactonase [Pseudomonadota bacterium]
MNMIEFVEGADSAQISAWLDSRLRGALLQSDGHCAIAVPGGSTPFPIFEQLVTHDIAFERLAVWPGDDRVVPEDHSASNTGKIRALFEPLGTRVVTLDTKAAPPRFALVWLGMGADGHIASLFPNTDPQTDDPQQVRRLTPEPLPPEAPFDRITLTIPALLNTDALMFVIRGKEKRAVFDAAIAGKNDLPIARLLKEARECGIPITCFT